MLKDVLSKAGRILEEAHRRLPVESAAVIEQVYGNIKNLNNFIDKEINSIEDDKDLNDSAKRTAKRKVLEQAGRKLEVLKAKGTLSTAAEELRKKMMAKPEKEEESILRFLREKEVRDRLEGMTAPEILSHFGDSLFDGSNPLLLDAILNAPPGFEMLPEDTLEKLKEVRGKNLYPEIAAELERLRELDSMAAQLMALLKKELDYLRQKELPVSVIKKNNRILNE
jgi:hypothetical protein